MATAPRRETLIALRARRTAHRVASDLYLFQHSKPLTIDCAKCRRAFCPLKDETICSNCVPHVPADPEAPRICWIRVGPWQQMWAETRWGELAMLAVFLCCFAAAIWALCNAPAR
jgi:hypothetical protein